MKKFILAASLLFSFPALAQNYQATQGAGTTFGTKLVGGVNYPQFTMCDPTTPAQCMAVDASGRVTVLQGTSPWVVSNGGTFATQATQAGTWTVQPGNTANTTAWLVTGTGGTFPATQSGTWNITNISGTVSLPTGAATSALQTSAAAAKGEGATAAAVPSGAQYWGINVGGNLTGVTGLSVGTARAPTVAIVDGSGNQITSFGGSGGTASNYGSAFPSSGTAAGFSDGTNMVAGRVKAASTTPLATDPSIVVTESPNSPVPTFLGAQADAACGTATGTCSLAGLIKYLNTAATSSIPAGTALIGDVNVRQGGTALSTTNGIYSNLLQGNAVISATNGLYNNLLQGNAVISATNGLFANQLQGNAVLSQTNPSWARDSDGTRARVLDPCEAATQTYAPISITTATTTQIVAASASNKTYICSLFLTSAAADNVGIVEGTGGTCGTGTAGVIGGTTAANGPNFAANGGVLLQAGGKTAIAQTAGTNVGLCLITSAATPLAGGIRYVQAP